MSQTATLILTHGQIHTLDRANPLAEAVAIAVLARYCNVPVSSLFSNAPAK